MPQELCVISCLKGAGKVVGYTAFFCVHFATLFYSSGLMLSVGASYYAENDEKYQFYTGDLGQQIGRVSAAWMQWLLSGFSTAGFAMLNQQVEIRVRSAMTLCLTALFPLFHYTTLPLSKQIVLGCSNTLKSSAPPPQCKDDDNIILNSFYTGFAFSLPIILGIFLIEQGLRKLSLVIWEKCCKDRSEARTIELTQAQAGSGQAAQSNAPFPEASHNTPSFVVPMEPRVFQAPAETIHEIPEQIITADRAPFSPTTFAGL